MDRNCSNCGFKEDCTDDEKDYGTQHDNNSCWEEPDEGSDTITTI